MSRRQQTAPRRARAAERPEPPDFSEDVERQRALYSQRPARSDAHVEHLRTPPMSVEAEQAVLGAMMLDETCFPQVKVRLNDGDFYRRDHQMIFRAICEAVDRGTPFDSVTLGEWFARQGLGDEVAGGAYLVELASTTPSAANVVAYADIVAEKSTMRRLIDAGTHIVNAGFNPENRSADEIMSESVSRLEAAALPRETAGVPIKQGLTSLYTQMQELYAGNAPVLGVSTPYPALSEMIDLFEPECYYGIAGRAKMGKSIMLNDVATHASLEGKAVGIWSIEMGETENHRRMLASVAGVDYNKLKKPRLLDDEDWSLLAEGIRKLKDTRVTSFFEPVVTIERIAAQAAMLKARGMLDIVLIDYLQIVTTVGKERRDLDIGHVSIGCKNMAKRLKVPVVAAMQFGRGNEKAGAKVRPPRASDLRESGNLEMDVDALIGIHRPGYYDKKSHGTRAEVLLNRNGETGIFRLDEDFAKSRFLHTNRPWIDDEPGGRGDGDGDGGFG